MAKVMLGMNACFAVGRYPEPEEWLEIVGKKFDLFRLAKDINLDYIMFEPMSVRREIPSTIAETEELHEHINKGSSLPIRLCMELPKWRNW